MPAFCINSIHGPHDIDFPQTILTREEALWVAARIIYHVGAVPSEVFHFLDRAQEQWTRFLNPERTDESTGIPPEHA